MPRVFDVAGRNSSNVSSAGEDFFAPAAADHAHGNPNGPSRVTGRALLIHKSNVAPVDPPKLVVAARE